MTSYPELSRTIPGDSSELSRPLPIGEDSSENISRRSYPNGQLEPTAAKNKPERVKVTGDLFHGQVPSGAIYVGRAAPGLRSSPDANPFPVKKYGLAESCGSTGCTRRSLTR